MVPCVHNGGADMFSLINVSSKYGSDGMYARQVRLGAVSSIEADQVSKALRMI
jgi:hypothetical protein